MNDSSRFSIAGVQMYVSAVQANVQAMKHKLQVLMSIYPWVDMVVFSELAPYGPLTHHAMDFPNDTEAFFSKAAKQYGIWLVPGSMFQKKEGKIYNTASVFNPQGELVGRYDKMFPFYPYEQGVEGGDEFLIWDVPNVGRFGLSICYDMWFPETSRTLAVKGVEVILHPTLTGTIDREIELAIAQATAAQNQCYIVDINGIGDGGIGKSIVCGPDGRVLYQAGAGSEFIPIEIDLEDVRRSRALGVRRLGQPLKSFRDRNVKFDIYQPGREHEFLSSLGPLVKPQKTSPLSPDGEKELLSKPPETEENRNLS